MDETVLVGKEGNRVLPERVNCLAVLPYKVYQVDIRLGTTFHFRVNAEKRNEVLQTAPTYHVPADVDMW